MLSVAVDAKTVKGERFGFRTGILYLAPHLESAEAAQAEGLKPRNMCEWSSRGCRAICLFGAGRGRMKNVRNARVRKTLLFLRDPVGFISALSDDIMREERKAHKCGFRFVVRLNGTSDIPWEDIRFPDGQNLMERHSRTQFYDYTKCGKRALDALNQSGLIPHNYHLTYSLSESRASSITAQWVLGAGGTVAAVYKKRPELWFGFRTTDGDVSDLRFLDPPRTVCVLRPKGGIRDDEFGFVRDSHGGLFSHPFPYQGGNRTKECADVAR
jgi:hypothetical protein